MSRISFFLLLAALLVCSCGDKTAKDGERSAAIDTIPMMLMQIQKCSRLYTAEYRVHKIVTHSDQVKLEGTFLARAFNINLPIGDRKVAIPMDATLKAYIDFTDFSEKNIRRNGNKIEILLPDPKVTLTSSKIDHDNVRKYVALLRSNFSDAEMTDYERQGRAAIIQSIPSLGIIEMAQESAARTLVPMIRQMGFREEDITITFRKRYAAEDLPLLLDKSTLENEKTD